MTIYEEENVLCCKDNKSWQQVILAAEGIPNQDVTAGKTIAE